ncbi:aldo/keto reductase [Tanacetum coccineum]
MLYKNVKRIKLGSQGLEVPCLGLGCMGMSYAYGLPKPEPDMIKLIHYAIDSGVTHLDTADVYGPHTNEILIGKALKGVKREDVQVATKFGQKFGESYGELEVHIALAVHPLTAVLVGVVICGLETPDDEVLPRLQGENLDHNKVVYERVSEMAKKKGCTPSQLALAWVLHQGDDVGPIPGTTKCARNLNENLVDPRRSYSDTPLCPRGSLVRWNFKRGPEFTWEREDSSLHKSGVFIHYNTLSLEDKAHLTGGDYNTPCFSVNLCEDIVEVRNWGELVRSGCARDGAGKGWNLLCGDGVDLGIFKLGEM